MKTSVREELAESKALLAMIEALPVSIAAREAEAAATLVMRQEAAAQIEALREEQAIVPKLRAAAEAVGAELKAHDTARKVLEEKQRIAMLTLMQEGNRIESDIRAAEVVLLSNYSPFIDEAIAFFRDKREVLWVKKPDVQKHVGSKNIVTERKPLHVFSTLPAIKAALAYCLDAIRQLEAMRLDPALDVERIERLKKAIPDFNEMSESVGSVYAGGYSPPIPAGPSRTNRLLAEAKHILGY